MREMKDSGIEWIGEIPADWEVIALKHIAHSNSEVLNENTDPDYEFDYIDIGSVIYGKGVTEFQHMNFASSPSRARRVVKADDVIISTVRTYLRAVAIIREKNSPQIVSTGFLALRSKNGIIHPTYLYYAVLSDNFIQNVESQSVGISYPAINSTTISTIKLPIAPYKEQQRIADYLDRKCSQIDAIIARQQEVIEKLKAYKLSVITEAVTKGLNPDVPMKDSGVEWIGDIPEDWEISKLKFMGHFVNGYAFPSSSFTTDGVRVMKIANIQPMEISWIDESYVDISEYDKLPMYRVEQGDLVFALTRPIINGGIKVAIFDGEEKVLLNQRNAMFKGLSRVLPRWMYYVMQNQMYVQKFALYIDGTGQQPNISTNEISQIEIPIPPIEVQQQVIMKLNEVIASIENLASLKERVIKQLSDYKKSLIYEVVTGKKEV